MKIPLGGWCLIEASDAWQGESSSCDSISDDKLRYPSYAFIDAEYIETWSDLMLSLMSYRLIV